MADGRMTAAAVSMLLATFDNGTVTLSLAVVLIVFGLALARGAPVIAV
jgi:hypothetical protein